jgi:hypothetical protein
MFRPIWPSSSVRLLVVQKLLCSFGVISCEVSCAGVSVGDGPSETFTSKDLQGGSHGPFKCHIPFLTWRTWEMMRSFHII